MTQEQDEIDRLKDELSRERLVRLEALHRIAELNSEFDRIRGDSRARAMDPGPDKPRWRHYCQDCTFLGRSDDGKADLYYCDLDGWPCVVSRDSDQTSNLSGIRYVIGATTSLYLTEAYNIALIKGLIKQYI